MSSMHQQIKEEIIQKIESGDYEPQSKLPTEAAFCDAFGVSRTTVRAALQQLTQEGYVIRRQGQGTFVPSRRYARTYRKRLPHLMNK